MSARVHWTKTREGKKRWESIQRRGWKARKKKLSTSERRQVAASARTRTRTTSSKGTKSHVSKRSRPQGLDEATFAYALGHVECWIQTFARSSAVPAELLAARLGEVLSSAGGR